MSGSSGSENGFYIDGTEVSDLRRGSLRDANNIPLEFVQEVQVKTGGYEAEFGGATGGVVNVATKSGTNAFHGSIGASVHEQRPERPGPRLLPALGGERQRVRVLPAPRRRLQHPVPGFTLGGPILKDQLHFFAAYSPDSDNTTRDIAYASGARSFEQTRTRHYSLGRLDFTPSSKVQMNVSYIWSPGQA